MLSLDREWSVFDEVKDKTEQTKEMEIGMAKSRLGWVGMESNGGGGDEIW